MKVVILSGGLGTRLAEETDQIPKPMVRVGPYPLLFHIMNHFASYGYKDFVICAGYKSWRIKEFFAEFNRNFSDLHIDLAGNNIQIVNPRTLDWTITIVDTGLETQTAGRLKRVSHLLDETFFLTYGDGLCDVDLTAEVRFHQNHGKQATVLAVRPPSRFAVMEFNAENVVERFEEKPPNEVGWVNGGYFVLEPKVIEMISSDDEVWEKKPMETLASSGELMTFPHEGFWQPVDTIRDLRLVNSIWSEGRAPWASS